MGGDRARRRAMICFDLEAQWGMPFHAPYDLEAAVTQILERLDAFGARAVFFVVGELVLRHERLIAAIAAGGHEIGLHGYRHERLLEQSDAQLREVADGMARAEAAIARICGSAPVGFRAPYLLAPRFVDPRVDALLVEHGYRWVSNCEVRHVVELVRPGLLRTDRLSEAVQARPESLDGALGRLVTVALNLRLLASGSPRAAPAAKLRWMVGGFAPYRRAGLVEVPVSGPLDCDVIGLPDPSVASSETDLRYAAFAMERPLAGRDELAMVTFHDWVVAGGNRPVLLERLLAAVAAHGRETVGGDELVSGGRASDSSGCTDARCCTRHSEC